MIQDLAYHTKDLPGTGGQLKRFTEDFVVEELPQYEPCGDGEHLYLFIEKRGMTTSDAIRRLAKLFRVGRRDIGYAGLKDKHAISRQCVSIHLPERGHDQRLLLKVEHTPIRVLWSKRHGNKLRRGHLAGNRFVIRVRDVDPDAGERAQRVLDHLQATGIPNYVGPQRFGYRRHNHLLGKLLLVGRYQELLDTMLGSPHTTDSPSVYVGREAYERGDYSAALDAWPKHLRSDRQALDALRQGKSAQAAVAVIDQQQRDLLVSSFQSAMFNRILHLRVLGGAMDRLIDGDLAWKHDGRSVFAVDAETAEVENTSSGRVKTIAVSPSGPMWGKNMTEPAGLIRLLERQVLTEEGIEPAQLAGGRLASASGLRRPLRVPLTNPSVSASDDDNGPYLQVEFTLPRGSFATIVMREIMKPKPDGALLAPPRHACEDKPQIKICTTDAPTTAPTTTR